MLKVDVIEPKWTVLNHQKWTSTLTDHSITPAHGKPSQNLRKPTIENSYVSDVRYISSSVKIYKGMSFYLRILFGRFIWRSFYLEIGIYYEESVYSILKILLFSPTPVAWAVSVGIFGRILWVSVDEISWTRSCLANYYSLDFLKRDEKRILGMKGSYITTPRYLMHTLVPSVKGRMIVRRSDENSY